MTLRPSLGTHSLWMDSDVADGKTCHFERASSSLFIMHGGSAGNAAILLMRAPLVYYLPFIAKMIVSRVTGLDPFSDILAAVSRWLTDVSLTLSCNLHRKMCRSTRRPCAAMRLYVAHRHRVLLRIMNLNGCSRHSEHDRISAWLSRISYQDGDNGR